MSKTALPRGWTEARLTEVAEINPPNPDVPPDDDTLVSFVPMAAVQVMARGIATSETRPWRKVRKGYKRFQDGDVLFAKITPCMENGKLAVATELHNGVGAGSTEFHVLRPSSAIRSDLLAYYLLRDDFRASARSKMKGTAGQLRVPQQFLETQRLPVPPPPEQKQIVERINSYFSRLDHVTAALEQVQRSLNRYRASILKAAVEGRLVPTEAEFGRAEGRDYEPASVLLKRILAERRRRWEEAELARMTVAGKTPTNDKWKARYKNPVAPDVAALPPLPEGWCWARVGEVGDVQLGRQRSPKRAVGPNMRPYMRAANVTWNGISLHDVKEMDFTPEEFETYALRRGDLLLSEASGSASEVGKPAIWNDEVADCCFQNTLIRVRAAEALAPFLHLHFYKDALTGAIARAARGVGIHHLGAKTLSDWEVHLPPLDEQRRIVETVDSYFTQLDHVTVTLERVERNLKGYRASILRAAFTGQLAGRDT